MGLVWDEISVYLSGFMATLLKGYVEPFLCRDQRVLFQKLTYPKLTMEIKAHNVFEWDLYQSLGDRMGKTAICSHRTYAVVQKCSLLSDLADE
jgi:hypothetical protein